MQSSRIMFLALVAIFVIIGSVVIGYGVAANQQQTIIVFGVIAGLLLCAFLGQRVWLLFLFLFSMEIPIIKGITTMELGYFILVGFSVLLFLIRRLDLDLSFTEMDFWRLALSLMILQVYMRNPVGLNMFSSSAVGGKPYFIAVCSLTAATILSKYRVKTSDLKLTRLIAIAAALIMFPLSSWRYGLGRGPSLSNVAMIEGFEGEGAGRNGKFERMCRTLSAILVSRISPLKASFHPIWGLLVMLTLAMAALSGYRNSVAYVGFILLIGIAYHGGFVQLFMSAILGAFALGALALFNLAYPLPPNVQRALSPFPGTWDERYVDAADNSTEWRIEMWKAALLTDDWIQNKVFGDGLGMTREEHEKMQDMQVRKGRRVLGGAVGLTVQQESMMISGNYHSGPVQSIRTVGYFGLAVMLMALTRMAVHAHRQIRRCWGTEWQGIMLFFGVPIIAYPFFFTFIFGTFQTAVAFVFIHSALIDLFSKNLPLPAYKPAGKAVKRPIAFGAARNGRLLQASASAR